MKFLFWHILTQKEVEQLERSAPEGYHLAKNPPKGKKLKTKKGGTV